MGEILIWVGVTIFGYPSLSGLQYVTMISPAFMYLLLTKVSGTPMLEKKADKKWGTDPAYILYKRNTPELFPFGPGDEVKVVDPPKKE